MHGSTRYILAMSMAAAGATAQVRLPSVPLPGLPQQSLQQTLDQAQAQSLDRLSELRHLEIGRLIRANTRVVDADPNGEPVVRDEILALGPADAALDHARALGFTVDREQSIGAMNIRLVVFRAPPGMPTKRALRTWRQGDPSGTYDYTHIHGGGGALFAGAGEPAGAAAHDAAASSPRAVKPLQARARIGLLDSGVDATHPVFRESVLHAWGCGNHSIPAAHGTAVASLLIGHSEVFHGVRPDAELYAADVFCGRPTGGAVDALVGTSFAAPFVAALLARGFAAPSPAAATAAMEALAKTAIDLGPPGRDLTYGFGLVGADQRIDPAPLIRR